MRYRQWLLITVLLLTSCTAAYGQEQNSAPETPTPPPVSLLRNRDVLRMMADGVKPGVIIAKILTSNCNFDVFPPVLRDLKRRGVPDTILLAMKTAPNGPPSLPEVDTKAPPTAAVRIPEGTAVEVETAHAVSSAKLHVGNPIAFVVTKRVFVNNVLVVERGALAMARVVKARSAGAWGRPGMLAWAMEYVVAVDGTRIPLKVTGKQKGPNRSYAIAGGAVATGALIFPYSSPVALIWGLKKGDEAILRGSKVFSAIAQTTDVAGLRPRPGGVIYHDSETVKASAAPPTSTAFDRSGFKPKAGFRPN